MTERCEGRYPVPMKRAEPFGVTYRCALHAGHLGECGDGNPSTDGNHGAEQETASPSVADTAPKSSSHSDRVSSSSVEEAKNAIQHRFMYGLDGDEEHTAPTRKSDTALIDTLIASVRAEGAQQHAAQYQVIEDYTKRIAALQKEVKRLNRQHPDHDTEYEQALLAKLAEAEATIQAKQARIEELEFDVSELMDRAADTPQP